MFDKMSEDGMTKLKKVLVITSIVLFIYLFVKVIFFYVAPFVFGFAISLIFLPVVNFANKKFNIHRGIVTLLLIILTIFLLSTVGTRVVIVLIEQSKALWISNQHYSKDIVSMFDLVMVNIENLFTFIPDEFLDSIYNVLISFSTNAAKTVGTTVKDFSLGFVFQVPNFLVSTILVIISSFFITKDFYILKNGIIEILPKSVSARFGDVKGGLGKAIVGYIKAQLIMMTITGTIAIIGLSLIGFPYSLIVGIIIAIIDALPIFGSGFVLWPLAAFYAITTNYVMAIKLLVIYGVITATRQMLEPKVLGDQIGINPVLTLMSMYAGIKIFGVLGFMIGPMILIISKVIYYADTIDVKKIKELDVNNM